MQHVTVLGAGGWGTALAVHLARVGHDVRLWARDPRSRRNRRPTPQPGVLPDVALPENVIVTASPKKPSVTWRSSSRPFRRTGAVP